ncbi:MAG TPA: type IV pilus secretin PilQ, partial [Terriglobales bacterium]
AANTFASTADMPKTPTAAKNDAVRAVETKPAPVSATAAQQPVTQASDNHAAKSSSVSAAGAKSPVPAVAAKAAGPAVTRANSVAAVSTPAAHAQAPQAQAVAENKADAAPARDLLASNFAPAPLADRTPAVPVQDVIVMHPQPKVALPDVKTTAEPKQELASAASVPVMAPVHAQQASAAPVSKQSAQQQAVVQAASGSCNMGRYTGEPISVNLKEVDLRDFFRLIHDISGLNIVLDPEVKGSLTIVLDDVPWDQALNIVLKNNRLDCQLEGNVLRVASLNTLKTEAEERVKEKVAQSEAVDQTTVTRYLSYATAKDVLPVLKQFLSSRGKIIADDRTNSLVIEDIPTTIPNLDRLIHELDRKSQQVEIEARVVATTRNFSRDIGTAVGFGWGNGVNTAVGGNPQVGNSPTSTNVIGNQWGTSGASSGSAAGQVIPLFSNLLSPGPTSGLALTNATRAYRLDFLLSLAEERGLAKILSRPRVITQNNISAVVRQGVRIPTVTQAQLSGPPTVSYTDAFLRLTVKPQITAEGTIFLNVDVENTSANFDKQVQGNPTLDTQQATTQVLVRDGGTVVIGGVIQTNNSTNIQQTPLLGSVPVLGNLFKRTSVTTQTQELIFFITPKIIEN